MANSLITNAILLMNNDDNFVYRLIHDNNRIIENWSNDLSVR